MVKRAWRRIGNAFESVGRRPVDAHANWLRDPFRDFRNQLNWAVLIIGGSLGVIMLIYYPDHPTQLVISASGLASLIAAIAALSARAKPRSIRRTWWALALLALTIVLMTLVHNFWPPLFPSRCSNPC